MSSTSAIWRIQYWPNLTLLVFFLVGLRASRWRTATFISPNLRKVWRFLNGLIGTSLIRPTLGLIPSPNPLAWLCKATMLIWRTDLAGCKSLTSATQTRRRLLEVSLEPCILLLRRDHI